MAIGVFPKPRMASSNPLFCPQSKDIQFTDVEDERNQKDVHLEEAGMRSVLSNRSVNITFLKSYLAEE